MGRVLCHAPGHERGCGNIQYKPRYGGRASMGVALVGEGKELRVGVSV